MSNRFRWCFGSVALLGLVSFGCSSEVTQGDFNAKLSRAICDKAYECLDEPTLANAASVYGQTRQECQSTYAAGAPLGCAPGQKLDRTAVDQCLNEVRAQRCSLVQTTGAVVTPFSCTSLCPTVTGDGGSEDARPLARRDGAADAADRDGASGQADDAATPDAPAGEATDDASADAGGDAGVD